MVEHIIIDGPSTYRTLETLQGKSKHNSVLVNEHDHGIYDALNKGLGLATGEVVGFLHSDDAFTDEQVLADVAKALVNPDIDAVYGDLDHVSNRNSGHVI